MIPESKGFSRKRIATTNGTIQPGVFLYNRRGAKYMNINDEASNEKRILFFPFSLWKIRAEPRARIPALYTFAGMPKTTAGR